MERIIKTLTWRDDSLSILDQSALPSKETYLRLRSIEEVWAAIKEMKVRGAPAIAIAASFGIVLASNKFNKKDPDKFLSFIEDNIAYMKICRPTAYNLFYALDRLRKVTVKNSDRTVPEIKKAILAEAENMFREDLEASWNIGKNGSRLIKDGMRILTHCNAGALATAGVGTALAVLFYAFKAGRNFEVYVDETRPLLQGARLTAWELRKAGIPHTLICDSAAGFLMKQGKIDLVLVGADRICGNGDTANKIGTYSLAVLAHHHGIPFYVAAPLSTFHFSLEHGGQIPIEERKPEEILKKIPPATAVYNPAFDVTPARLIKGFITEKGVFPPDRVKDILR